MSSARAHAAAGDNDNHASPYPTAADLEHLSPDLRATVTTTAPNFVRGAVPLLTAGFIALKPGLGVPGAALGVGAVCLALALFSVWSLDETFGRDLDFVEE